MRPCDHSETISLALTTVAAGLLSAGMLVMIAAIVIGLWNHFAPRGIDSYLDVIGPLMGLLGILLLAGARRLGSNPVHK